MKLDKIIDFPRRGAGWRKDYTRIMVTFKGLTGPIEVDFEKLMKAFPDQVGYWYSNEAETDSDISWSKNYDETEIESDDDEHLNLSFSD